MPAEHPEQPGRVPLGELRELVEWLRYDREQRAGSAGNLAAAKAYEEAADKLESLADEHAGQ